MQYREVWCAVCGDVLGTVWGVVRGMVQCGVWLCVWYSVGCCDGYGAVRCVYDVTDAGLLVL